MYTCTISYLYVYIFLYFYLYEHSCIRVNPSVSKTLFYIFELMLHCRTVTTKFRMTPSSYRAIFIECSKSFVRRLQSFYIGQRCRTTVTTSKGITKSNSFTIWEESAESFGRWLKLNHTFWYKGFCKLFWSIHRTNMITPDMNISICQ